MLAYAYGVRLEAQLMSERVSDANCQVSETTCFYFVFWSGLVMIIESKISIVIIFLIYTCKH